MAETSISSHNLRRDDDIRDTKHSTIGCVSPPLYLLFRKPRLTKAERQAQHAKQQMESALVSLTRNDSFGREDEDDEEDDVEEVSDDDDDSFSGQFMVKVEWKLDIFRLPVFPVGLRSI